MLSQQITLAGGDPVESVASLAERSIWSLVFELDKWLAWPCTYDLEKTGQLFSVPQSS